MKTKAKYNGEKITFMRIGDDWTAIWLGETQIHYHDSPDFEETLIMLGIEYEILNITLGHYDHRALQGKTITQAREWNRRRSLKEEREKLKALKTQQSAAEARINELTRDEDDTDANDD